MALMKIGGGQLIVLMFIPLGLSMTCWNEPDIREESAVAVCTEMSARTSNTCRWDIPGDTEHRGVDGSVSFSELPSSANDARVFWTCSLRYKLPPSYSYYYVYFGESQDRRRLAFVLNIVESIKCWYLPDVREWNAAVVCTEMSARTSNTCRWDIYDNTQQYRELSQEGAVSFSELPTSANDSRVLWNCSMRHKMIPPPPPPTELFGGFYDYAYDVYFGESQDRARHAFLLTIIDPGEPVLKCCPQSVKDGDNITCECTTQREGIPPPSLSWRGQTTSVLHVTDVRLDKVQATYTCEMIWGNQSKTVSYTFVDPGELILKNCPQSVKDGDNITCECTTQRTGHPPPILSWRGQTTSVLHFTDVRLDKVQATYTCEMIWRNRSKTVSYSFGGKLGSRNINIATEATNGQEGERRSSQKSDSSSGSPARAAGNGGENGGSTSRSSSEGSDKPSSNPNYASTALQEVEIHAYTDLHTRDPTYAATTFKKDVHTYMELRTLSIQSQTPQTPGETNRSSDGYETPQPIATRSQVIQEEEATYYNTA